VSATRLAPGRFVLAQLIETGRITTNAPASDESDGAGRPVHVDGHRVTEDTARSGRRDRPSAETAIFIEPLGHRGVAGTDPISGHADHDPDGEALLGLGDDRPWIAGHVSAVCDVRP
jgi:hypothetical protein